MMRYIGKLCVLIEDDYFVILMLILRILFYLCVVGFLQNNLKMT